MAGGPESDAVGVGQVLDLFPTPVVQCVVHDHAELDREVTNAVLALRDAEAERPTDRLAGDSYFDWQSRNDLQHNEPFDRVAGALTGAARLAVEEIGWEPVDLHLTECWANVAEAGGAHAAHTHPNSFLSGVYFVTAPEGVGSLQFLDPRPQARTFHVETIRPSVRNAHVLNLEPEPGRVVIFPSWLAHRVAPTAPTAPGPRITVAANFMPIGPVGRPTMHYRLEPGGDRSPGP